MSLEILYRDEEIIAVYKPAGQLVHPADHPRADDEVTMKILRDQIGKQVHALHRLDRPTCGVLLFATEPKVVKKLRQAFDRHLVEKRYLAVVIGHPESEHWICEEPLQKTPGAPLRDARTDFTVLALLSNDLSLLEARPKSGRFHQIRRHLLHAGHPILGDYLYAGIERSDDLGARLGTGTRMLLQAKAITFPHPGTGDQLTITAPTDPLIEKICQSKQKSPSGSSERAL